MPQRLLHAIAPGTRLRILTALKRTQGLTVKELAEKLGMSYMGVKDMSSELHQRGLLEVWRQPRPENRAGRPRLVYRLTDKAHTLFPTASNPLTLELLEATRKLHGPSAPEKLLLTVWQQKAASLESRLNGAGFAERMADLARLRDEEGHMTAVEGDAIIEHHCPYLDVMREYPLVAKLDADLFSRLLRVPVTRTEDCAGGLYRAIFTARP